MIPSVYYEVLTWSEALSQLHTYDPSRINEVDAFGKAGAQSFSVISCFIWRPSMLSLHPGGRAPPHTTPVLYIGAEAYSGIGEDRTGRS